MFFDLTGYGAYPSSVNHKLGFEYFFPGRLALRCGGMLPGTFYPWRLDLLCDPTLYGAEPKPKAGDVSHGFVPQSMLSWPPSKSIEAGTLWGSFRARLRSSLIRLFGRRVLTVQPFYLWTSTHHMKP